uniref:Uncharacterized protein ycf68 n=1 Tax=Fagus sylvatica TaxID=28930 RepID=A0A2N9ID32_FAGSY
MDSGNAMQCSWTLMSIRMNHLFRGGKSLPARQEDSKLQILSRMNAGGMLNTCKSDGKWCFQWRTATLGLRHGPDSYGRQQWGIFRNGRKPDGAMPRGAAVIQRMQALSGMIGRKASVGGFLSPPSNPRAQPWTGGGNYQAGVRGANGIRYPSSPSRKRWILGAVRIDPCSAVANALSIPPGEGVPSGTRTQVVNMAVTGGAWLSSARATAGDKPEEGEDDVKSSCPLCPGRHTCYNGRDKGSRSREGELTPKTRPQFGLCATRLHTGIASKVRRSLPPPVTIRASDWSEARNKVAVLEGTFPWRTSPFEPGFETKLLHLKKDRCELAISGSEQVDRIPLFFAPMSPHGKRGTWERKKGKRGMGFLSLSNGHTRSHGPGGDSARTTVFDTELSRRLGGRSLHPSRDPPAHCFVKTSPKWKLLHISMAYFFLFEPGFETKLLPRRRIDGWQKSGDHCIQLFLFNRGIRAVSGGPPRNPLFSRIHTSLISIWSS